MPKNLTAQIGVLQQQINALKDSITTILNEPASPVVASGTYTPVLADRGNTSARQAYVCQYLRVGNVVTVSGRFDITPTAGANTYTSISITCPIAPTFSTCNEAGGTGSVFQDSTKLTGGFLADCGDGTKMAFSFYAPDTASHTFTFTFTYKIA